MLHLGPNIDPSNSSQFRFAAAQVLVLQVRSMSVDTEPAVMHHHSAPFVPTDSNLTMLACLQAWWRIRIYRGHPVSWAMSERYNIENLHERISLRSYDAAPCNLRVACPSWRCETAGVVQWAA